jgi:hypothetical protein
MRLRAIALVTLAIAAPAARAGTPCRSGDFAVSDARAVAGVRGAIARQCPCDDFDGSSTATSHGAYVGCAKTVIADAMDGSPLLGAYTLREECRNEVKKIYRTAACGYKAASPRVACCQFKPTTGKLKGSAKKVAQCVDSPSGKVTRAASTPAR